LEQIRPVNAWRSIIISKRITLVVILDVQHRRRPHLLEIALAGCATCVLARACEDREQNRRQECYYSYDDKQLNKRKPRLNVFLELVLALVLLPHDVSPDFHIQSIPLQSPF